jgi:hypothetical protein
MRSSGAYIDMSPVDTPELRRLHPVGAHWPRVVCRPAGNDPRLCGLLVEGASSRQIAAARFTLDQWNQAEVGVLRGPGLGAVGSSSLFGLAPSTTNGAHTLSFDLTFADGPAVLSLFARPVSGKLLRADVPGVASATFDVSKATVIDSSGTRVVSAEPWGDGLVRLSYSFDIAPGPGSLQLTLLADDGAAAFAGNGEVALEAGDVELRFRQFSTPLPMLEPIQAADLLVFPAGNGNFPAGGSFGIDAEFWLPAAPLIADVALVNANFATQYEQQINLFVIGPQRNVRFGSLLAKDRPWTVTDTSTMVTDGELHQVRATVANGEATLVVDGVTTRGDAKPYDTSMLDRIEVGASKNSSGALTGILRHVSIAAP